MSGKSQRSLFPVIIVILFLFCLCSIERETSLALQASPVEQSRFDQLQPDLPDSSRRINDSLKDSGQLDQTVPIADESPPSSKGGSLSNTKQPEFSDTSELSRNDIALARIESVEDSPAVKDFGLPIYNNIPSAPEPNTPLEPHPAPEFLFHEAGPFLNGKATEATGSFAGYQTENSAAVGSSLFGEITFFTWNSSRILLKTSANQPSGSISGKSTIKSVFPSLDFDKLIADIQDDTGHNLLVLSESLTTPKDVEFLRTGFKDYINGGKQWRIGSLNLLLDRLSVQGSFFASAGRIQLGKYIEFRGNCYVDMAGLNARSEYRLYLINLPLVKKIRIASRRFDFSSPRYGYQEPGLGRGFRISVNDFSLSDRRFLSFAEIQAPPVLGSRGIVSTILHNRFSGFELGLSIDLPNIRFSDFPLILRLPSYDWRFR